MMSSVDSDIDAVDVRPIVAPGVGAYLRYCIGGSLPPRNSSWVLHDVSCPTWWLRHVARTTMVVLPLFVLYLLLVPASLQVRLLTGGTFALGLFVFSFVSILIDTDRRAVRAGYDSGLPSRIRGERAVDRQRQVSFDRRERIAGRRERRR